MGTSGISGWGFNDVSDIISPYVVNFNKKNTVKCVGCGILRSKQYFSG